MRKIIVILLATVLLLTACGKKAEKPNESEPTQSESETMSTESKTAPTESETTPRESDTIPSESESDTVQATELDHHIEMYDENDVVYAKELTPVKHVENPTYRIEGYYATPSEAFAGYPIIHCHGNLAEKPWNKNTASGFFVMASMLPMDEKFLPDDFIEDYCRDKDEVPYRTDEERKYIDNLSPDSVVFKDDTKIPSAFVIELDETAGVLVEMIARTNGERINAIDYHFTKVFAYGKLIDISEYLVYVDYLKMSGSFLEFQGDSVYVEVFNRGRLKITEDAVSFTEGYWGYFYDDECNQIDVFDEYGQEISWGFHAGKTYDDIYPLGRKPADKPKIPYWD